VRGMEIAWDRAASGLCLGENIHAIENKMGGVRIT